MSGTGTDEGTWRDRLARAAEACHAHRAAYEDELEARDALVLEAIDLGWPRSKVARWARLSTTRVTHIVAARAAVELAGA